MSHNSHFSDEHLNAFIDNQLATSDQAELLDALRHDEELSQRICDLQKVRNLVQLSYQDTIVPDHYHTTSKHKKFAWAIAASLLLMVGSITGWIAHTSFSQPNLLSIAKNVSQPHINKDGHWKVMLQVSTNDPYRLNILLDETEALLKEYAHNAKQLEVEILTHNKGMALVSDNGKDYSQRLQKLKQTYKNLAITACGKTLKRIKAQKGKDLKLLPDTKIVKSALNQAIKRQQQGWTHIKI